jgi:DNA-binding FadR family transcriptional regulator
MSGGEETNLREVLQAKRNVELPSAEAAFTVVTASFEKQLQETLGTEAHALISRALEAMRDAREAIARMAETPSPPPGAPKPGSTEELDEELAKEKLDP